METKEERLKRQEATIKSQAGGSNAPASGSQNKGNEYGGFSFPPKSDKGAKRSDLLALLFGTMIVVVLIKFAIPDCVICSINAAMKNLQPGPVYDATQSPQDLPVSREVRESISISRVLELRGMLRARKYDKLNAALQVYQKDFEADQTDEHKVYDAYNSFDLTNPSYEKYLKEWKGRYPDDYQPHLAIARYYYTKGWESRGTGWAKDMTEEQVEGMKSYFSMVEDNLAVALDIKPNSMPAHRLMISISNASAFGGDEDELIKKAHELFPRSYLIGTISTWAKEPRWGGSYREMESIARKAEEYSDVNPRLTALYGHIYYDQARILYGKDEYDDALELITKAISFGDNASFYWLRAKIYYYKLKKYDLALENINRAIEIHSVDSSYYIMRSRVNFKTEYYNDSLDDLSNAESLSPGDPDVIDLKIWTSEKLVYKAYQQYKAKDYAGSLENYDLAIEFNDENGEAYYWRGMSYVKLSDESSALSDFQEAVEFNPTHIQSYRMLDWLLAKENRWEEIIEYWDTFIELDPENGDAYYERSGTHYHNRDMPSAMRDLARACELGNEEACARQKKMTSRN